jgi:hypothetical protein
MKDLDKQMSYLKQILADSKSKDYIYCIVGTLERAPGELLEP